MLAKLAWRNIWRNPKRTAVILAAVVVGVWSMLVMVALSRGMATSMVDNAISSLVGHIQIHAEGYTDDPVVENALPDAASSRTALSALKSALPEGSAMGLRIRVGAVASNARNSTGITLVGIDPGLEEALSFYGDGFADGGPLKPEDDRGIIIGAALAEQFKTKVGKKIVLMSQSTNGEVASRAFRIRGLFRAEMEAMEKGFVFVTRTGAAKLLSLNLPTGICAVLPDAQLAESVVRSVRSQLPKGLIIESWQEMLPVIVAYVGMFDTFLWVWYIIIFTAMGFGIVNTLLMAVLERVREFGLLKSLGLRPSRIVFGVLLEAFCLMGVGVLIGDLLAWGTVAALPGGLDLSALGKGQEFMGMSRIIHLELLAPDVLRCNLVVLVLGQIVSLYPALKAARITPVQALAHT